MAYHDRIDAVKSEIDALITYANGVTGESDADIGECVHTLADGYGSGGADGWNETTLEAVYTDVLSLFNAIIENGNVNNGDFVVCYKKNFSYTNYYNEISAISALRDGSYATGAGCRYRDGWKQIYVSSGFDAENHVGDTYCWKVL